MSSPTTIVLGYAGKVYWGPSPRVTWGGSQSPSSGIWIGAAPAGLTEMTLIRAVTDSSAYEEADGTTRASQGVKLVIPALMAPDFELEFPWIPGDPGFQALRAAYFGRTQIALAILDGSDTVSGTGGTWGDYQVLAFPREEPEDKEMLVKAKVKPGPSTVPFQAVQVA